MVESPDASVDISRVHRDHQVLLLHLYGVHRYPLPDLPGQASAAAQLGAGASEFRPEPSSDSLRDGQRGNLRALYDLPHGLHARRRDKPAAL